MIRSIRTTLPAALALIGLAAFASVASAAVYVPTKTADTADGLCDPADCSLREAILAANDNPGEDVILLHAGVYLLTLSGNEDVGAAGDLDVQGDLVLLGDGPGHTIIDGRGVDHIFQIASGVTAEIRDVTLRDGRSEGDGGAILNNGRLTLTRIDLSSNSATGDGGAIATRGSNSSLTLTASALGGNISQARGGAVAIGGTVDLANLTIAANQARLGGGLYVLSDARLTVSNVTLAVNRAAAQGGGVFVESSAFIGVPPRFRNSLLAGNSAATDPDCSGPIDSAYDLIANNVGCVGPQPANHDLVGTVAHPIDPKLVSLLDSGGPTPSLPLLAGSPAIDAGSPAAPGSADACEATDQRGIARPAGSRCDIGAFEVTSACVPGPFALCLLGGRFKVTAVGQLSVGGSSRLAEPLTDGSEVFEVESIEFGLTPQKAAVPVTLPGLAVPLTDGSGFFEFEPIDLGLKPRKVDLTVTMLNGCASNGRYGLFAAGQSSAKVDITVLDTKTGKTRTYSNPKGLPFRSFVDRNALATCP